MAGQKPLLYQIYSDLVSAVSGIGKKTFLERPKTVSEELANFIVIALPTELVGMFKGKMEVMAGCYGTFSVFCKAKTDNTLNIVAQSDLVQKVLDVFPINGTHITATDPRVLMQGEDGYGFQVTQISFSLRTKFNARTI